MPKIMAAPRDVDPVDLYCNHHNTRQVAHYVANVVVARLLPESQVIGWKGTPANGIVFSCQGQQITARITPATNRNNAFTSLSEKMLTLAEAGTTWLVVHWDKFADRPCLNIWGIDPKYLNAYAPRYRSYWQNEWQKNGNPPVDIWNDGNNSFLGREGVEPDQSISGSHALWDLSDVEIAYLRRWKTELPPILKPKTRKPNS